LLVIKDPGPMLIISSHSRSAIYIPSRVSSSLPRYNSARVSGTSRLVLHIRQDSRVRLSLPLKVRTRSEESDALIHDRLADPEVVVDPLLDARCFAELVGLDTGTVSARVSRVLFWYAQQFCGGGCIGREGNWRRTYVRPVERRTPARKADTRKALGLRKQRLAM
jgi:hypothetical protein